MTVHPLSRLEVSTHVLKRAQYEAFEFELDDDDFLVRNGSHQDSENHEYAVTVTDGVPIYCECPADEAYEGGCNHRIAVAIRTPVLEAAVHTRLVADGSGLSNQPLSEEQYLAETNPQHPPNASDELADSDEASCGDTDEKEYPCECDDLLDEFPCWNCVFAGRRSLPDS